MINLRSIVPHIREGDGSTVAFDPDSLTVALERAARKAGYEKWEPLQDFSATFALHLRETHARGLIDRLELDTAVRHTLRDVGYREIAARFRTLTSHQTVSLEAVLGRSDLNRATFFRRLAAQIARANAAGVRRLHFRNLGPCTERLLEGPQTLAHWSELLLKQQIVAFIQEQIAALAWNAGVHFSIV